MGGNAHRNRQRRRPSQGHDASTCVFCKARPKFANYKNSNGHRHNPERKHRQKRGKRN